MKNYRACYASSKEKTIDQIGSASSETVELTAAPALVEIAQSSTTGDHANKFDRKNIISNQGKYHKTWSRERVEAGSGRLAASQTAWNAPPSANKCCNAKMQRNEI